MSLKHPRKYIQSWMLFGLNEVLGMTILIKG